MRIGLAGWRVAGSREGEDSGGEGGVGGGSMIRGRGVSSRRVFEIKIMTFPSVCLDCLIINYYLF